METKGYLQKNGLMISMILLSLLVSIGYFILIDYCLDMNYIEVRTTTFGYILCSLILGFTSVWVPYRIIEWLYKRKIKNKKG